MEYISEICEECLCGRHCQGKYPVISEKDCEFFSEEEE